MTDQTRDATPRCLACGQDSDQAPLLPVRFRGADLWICAQDLPLLIHQPDKLADRLPGAETLRRG